MSNEELALLIQETNDDTQRNELLTLLRDQNTGITHKICGKYAAFADSIEDLEQQAFFSLWTAAKTWRADKSVSYIAYYTRILSRDLLRYVMDCNGVIRLPEQVRRNIWRYEQAEEAFIASTGRKPKAAEAAAMLDVDVAEIPRIKKYIRLLQMRSLDEPLSDDEGGTLADLVADTHDQGQACDDQIDRERLANIVWPLVDQECRQKESLLLREKYQSEKSNTEIAAKLGVSIGRVDALHKQALIRLRSDKVRSVLAPYWQINAYNGTGLSSFQKTGMSVVERIVLLRNDKE